MINVLVGAKRGKPGDPHEAKDGWSHSPRINTCSGSAAGLAGHPIKQNRGYAVDLGIQEVTRGWSRGRRSESE